MKTIKKQKAVIEEFASVAEFVNHANNAKPNKYFATRSLSSQDKDEWFTGTKNYEEAEDLLRHGYKEGLQNLMSANTKLTQRNNNQRPMIHADVVGFAPIVPNAIIGLPKSMMRRQRVVQSAPIVNIIYDTTIAGSEDKDMLFKGGKNLLALVKSIESQGYRVNLKVGYISSADRGAGKSLVSCLVNIKNASQSLNPLLVSYPLTHPSFFRRHMFRWVEICEHTANSSYFSGYGYVFKHTTECERYDNVRDYLKAKEVLGSNDYYVSAYEASAVESLEQMYKIMGLTK